MMQCSAKTRLQLSVARRVGFRALPALLPPMSAHAHAHGTATPPLLLSLFFLDAPTSTITNRACANAIIKLPKPHKTPPTT